MSNFLKFISIAAFFFFIYTLINRFELSQSFEKNKSIEIQKKKSTIVKKVKNKNLSNTITYNTIKKSVKNTSRKTENIIDEEKRDNPWGAYDQDFERTMNPSLGRPTPEILPSIVEENILQQKKRTDKISYAIPGTASAPWVERGPNNVGGRTKALAWDPNDPAGKKVWAGGATGGLWYNNDITDSLSSWNKINDFCENLSISDIVFDPQNPRIIYVTTGSSRRAPAVGIYKSIDAGVTWNILTSTSTFTNIIDLKIRVENGVSVLYSANYFTYHWTPEIITGKWFYDSFGLFTSRDGGLNWQNNSIGVPYKPNSTLGLSSIDVNRSNNRIWLSTNQTYTYVNGSGGRVIYNDANLVDGLVWYKSDSLSVDSARDNNSTVVSAPSNPNIAYSIISSGGKVIALRKTTNAGSSWISLPLPVDADKDIDSNDFTRGQAFIHQALAIDPNDPNIVIVGGIDLFKSIDGGNTWKQISKWSENQNMNLLTKISTVHADHLNIVYKPGSSNEVIFGTDGGVFYTSNIKGADSLKVIKSRNKNYNITQFYSAAIDPNIDNTLFLAGAQDNGTQLFEKSGVNETYDIRGGDGGYCFIDQNEKDNYIVSTTKNDFGKIYKKNNQWSYLQLLNNDNNGQFINYAAYDNNLHILYTNRNDEYIYRVLNVTGTSPKVDSVKIPGLISGMPITSMMVSPFYEFSSTLFLGTKDINRKPKLYIVLNAQSTPQVIDISSSSFPGGGNISSIAFGRDENELAVTFYNYGIPKIWYTRDGGSTWQNKSSNFPNIPVRWAIFNPNKYGEELVLATELGTYSTTNLSATTPPWTQTNNGFANVRTDMLQLRNSDFTLIASTHGRGLFSSKAFSEAAAPIVSSVSSYIIGDGDTLFVKGKNLTNTSQVKIGGFLISNYTVLNDSTLRLIINGAISGRLSVKTPGGIATISYIKYNQPKIYSFSPSSAGLYVVMIIKGENLSSIKKVIIGNKDALFFEIKSDSVIQATIPDSAQDGTVKILNESYSFEKTGFKACVTPKVSSSGPITFCEGGSVSLSVSNATSVNWLNQDSQRYFSTDTLIKINKSGLYIAYVLANSCYSFTKYTNVSVNPIPNQLANVSIDACQNSASISLSAQSNTGNSIIWYNSLVGGTGVTTAPVQNTNEVGIYKYYFSQINNSTKCESPRANYFINILKVPPKPIIKRANDNYLESSNLFGNIWFKDGVQISTIDTFSRFLPKIAGSYSVRTSLSNCISQTSELYYHNAMPLVTDVYHLDNNQYIQLSPNPIRNFSNLSFSLNGQQKINLHIVLISNGQVVKKLLNLNSDSKLDFSSLSGGLYLFQFFNSQNQFIHQFKMLKL